MIDTHCHLTEPALTDNLDHVMAEAAKAGVDRFVVPSVDLKTSADAAALARRFPSVLAAVGIHPLWSDFTDGTALDSALQTLRSLVLEGAGRVRAIGEIGLDAGPPASGDMNQVAVTQEIMDRRRSVFLGQLELARELNLPVLLHWRPTPVTCTFADMVLLLEKFGPIPAGGILHAFGGSLETAARLRPLGWFRGVAGTITRPDAARLRKTIADTPLSDMVLETDAPFIANSRHARGQVVPADLPLSVETIARIKGIPPDEVAAVVDGNADRLFNA